MSDGDHPLNALILASSAQPTASVEKAHSPPPQNEPYTRENTARSAALALYTLRWNFHKMATPCGIKLFVLLGKLSVFFISDKWKYNNLTVPF